MTENMHTIINVGRSFGSGGGFVGQEIGRILGIPVVPISAIHNEKGEEKLNLLMIDDAIPAGAKLG